MTRQPDTEAGRALLEREAYNSRSFALITADAILAIEAEAREGALDRDALYRAITDELVVLWGEPSDGISAQIRPIVARSIAERYADLRRPALSGSENTEHLR